MKQLIKENKWFLYPFFCYLIVGFAILLSIEKGEDIWFFNRLHNPISDFIAQYLTHLGDGLFAALLILGLLAIRFDYFFWGALSFGISAALAQGLKRLVFSDMARPLKYMGEKAGLHLVEGVTVHHDFSFPSGHGTTAFMLFFVLSLVQNNKKMGFLYFLVALIVSLTRPYLVQHFFEDIYVGAIIGVATTLLVWQIKPRLWFRK
jgi:membrane-associated phospholipid phosphatase